jgi:hypothetical protein
MLTSGFWLALTTWIVTSICAAWAASAETALEVRLLTPVSSYSSKTGTEIQALLATRLCGNSIQMVPEGTVVRGRIARVHRVGLGLIHETARLDLEFDEMRFPDGRSYPLEARLVGVDSARERVDSHGRIHGIRATAALSNRAGQRLAFAALGNPVLMIPAFVVSTALFRFPDPEISYPEGTELYLDVHFRDSLAGLTACSYPQPEPTPELAELHRLVAGLPVWSYSVRQRQPMDLVDLVFVGSADELARAFVAAGWSGARGNSMSAGFGAIRAIAGDSGDAEAPMRTLLLDGAAPDFTYQRSLNTFAKRHHLRIWKRSEQWQGRTIWASAATRDIAATFSVRPFGFTHQIEDQVDFEREKVVSDLVFTGCVASVSYVQRASGYRAGVDYRRGVNADSRVAVVELNSCESPRRSPAAETPAPRPRTFGRGLRRVLLTARNHFMRQNIYWESADAARMGWLTLRSWRRAAVDEHRARLGSGFVAPLAAPAEPAWLAEPPSLNGPAELLPEIHELDTAGAPGPSLPVSGSF